MSGWGSRVTAPFGTRSSRQVVCECRMHGDESNRKTFKLNPRSLDALNIQVSQKFSLTESTFTVSYLDEDNEVFYVDSDNELNKAIDYFSQAIGQQREIKVALLVSLEFSGRLSDTASLQSRDDDASQKYGSDDELDLEGSDVFAPSMRSFPPAPELEDDAMTIGSRDTMSIQQQPKHRYGQENISSGHSSETRIELPTGYPSQNRVPSSPHSSNEDGETLYNVRGQPGGNSATQSAASQSAASSDFRAGSPPLPVLPEAGVFEKLKESSSSDLFRNRNELWLRNQDEIGLRNVPGHGVSDSGSIDLSASSQAAPESELRVHTNERGMTYYDIDEASVADSRDFGMESVVQSEPSRVSRPLPKPPLPHRPSQAGTRDRASSYPDFDTHHHRPAVHTSHSVPEISTREPPESSLDILANYDPEVREFIKRSKPAPPPKRITDCSACGDLLDTMRYICGTCGKKDPSQQQSTTSAKGKERALGSDYDMVDSQSQSSWSSNQDAVPLRQLNRPRTAPLLRVPSNATLTESGYELCISCIEEFGRIHAESAPLTSPSSATLVAHSPTGSPDGTFVPMQARPASRRRTQARHAFVEEMWGWDGWASVEHADEGRCSTCGAVSTMNRFKCCSCDKFELCRACYGQVHEIHPIHAFLVVPDKVIPRPVEAPVEVPVMMDPEPEEPSMIHPGVKCFHCLQDIVGALFHCVVCTTGTSVDICSNCETAGLPGNLTALDGGHVSSHIMLKIPRPANKQKIDTLSAKALDQWNRRDSAQLGRTASNGSPYAPTVVSSSRDSWVDTGVAPRPDDHGVHCRGCNKAIIGIRYQCACCPSLPIPFNLCADCEVVSFVHHDPMHVFLRIEHPLDYPIQTPHPLMAPVYEVPAGQDRYGNRYGADFQDYLDTIEHPVTHCDLCVNKIRGAWLRCACCGSCDHCEDCYANGAHSEMKHVFLVFKSHVNIKQFHHVANLVGQHPDMGIIRHALYK